MSKHPDNIIKIAEALLETNKKHCQEINELRKEVSDLKKVIGNLRILIGVFYDLLKKEAEK